MEFCCVEETGVFFAVVCDVYGTVKLKLVYGDEGSSASVAMPAATSELSVSLLHFVFHVSDRDGHFVCLGTLGSSRSFLH